MNVGVHHASVFDGMPCKQPVQLNVLRAVSTISNKVVNPSVDVDADVTQLNGEIMMLHSCFDAGEVAYFQTKTGIFSRSNYCNAESDSPFPIVSSSPRIAFDAQSCAG